MEENFKILIENYNLRTKSYELGKQEVLELNSPQLKILLKEIPVLDSEDFLSVQIVTENLILRKLSNDLYFYDDNHQLTIFQTPVDIDLTKFEEHLFKINEIEEILQIIKPIKKKSNIIRILNNDYSMIILPIANIFFIIIILLTRVSNALIIIILIWLIAFSAYCAIYDMISIIKVGKNPQKIKLEYIIPLIGKIEKIDISEIIVYIGQLGLLGFLVMYFLEFSFHFSIPLLIIIIIISFFYIGLISLFTLEYFSMRKIKRFLLKIVSYEIHKSLDIELKQFYLILSNILERKNIISAGSFPKFTSILLFLISIFPIITYFYS